MNLSWSARRQLLYYAVGIFFATILLFTLWQMFFTRTPTCTDGIWNGSEEGIDCGGACAKLCTEDAETPSILWARAFESGPQAYTAIAYVENRNQGAGARNVPFSFRLFDEDNELVVEREGLIDIPPIGTVPIVVPNVNVGNRSVARTLFRFTAEPTWERVRADALPHIRLSGQSLTADGSRLSATLTNEGFTEVRDLMVVGVVFDAEGVARAASVTVLGRIAPGESQPAIFTWSKGVPDVARAEITVLPTF